jgi:hypothetical protein
MLSEGKVLQGNSTLLLIILVGKKLENLVSFALSASFMVLLKYSNFTKLRRAFFPPLNH